MLLDRKWFESVKRTCIIRGIKLDDIDPDKKEDLEKLYQRILVSH